MRCAALGVDDVEEALQELRDCDATARSRASSVGSVGSVDSYEVGGMDVEQTRAWVAAFRQPPRMGDAADVD